jgi:hypothetical protein
MVTPMTSTGTAPHEHMEAAALAAKARRQHNRRSNSIVEAQLRVPYPLGFYAKRFDGRIDDASAGWKGRGLWTTSGDRAPWLMEGGKGKKPVAVHFQLRPDPLAR